MALAPLAALGGASENSAGWENVDFCRGECLKYLHDGQASNMFTMR